MVHPGLVDHGLHWQHIQATQYKTNEEEIYRALTELQSRTHSQQAEMPSYLKADWLLHVYAMQI